MSIIAGLVLIVMMIATFGDIIMRFFGKPIVGVYEVVAFLGVAVTGFALPRASLMKAQVYVDLLVDKLSLGAQRVLRIMTRIVVFFMFLIASWYFVRMGMNFIATNTVTMSLRVPFYPVVFGLALSCIVQCLVAVAEIVEAGGSNERICTWYCSLDRFDTPFLHRYRDRLRHRRDRAYRLCPDVRL
jgi:TRAP-type C4-dicarboxylate transport system permease small subunit